MTGQRSSTWVTAVEAGPPSDWTSARRAPGTWFLPGLAAQLQRGFDRLVDAGRADRVAAGLQPAHGQNRASAVQAELPS